MRRESTPLTKVETDLLKERKLIRRRYKTNIDRDRRILPGQADFITDTVLVLRLVNYSYSQIARIVGISRNQVSEICRTPETAERLVHLQTNISKSAITLLESYLVEAVQVVVEILRTSGDDAIRLKAAGEVFDRAGMPKSTRQEKKEEIETKTTFTNDGIVDAIRQLPPEKQEEAAQMIEKFEQLLSDTLLPVSEEE